MPKKLQQFIVLKFTSGRLKKNKYKINITLDEARKNGEAISIGNSQTIRSLLKIKGDENRELKLKELFSLRGKIKKEQSTTDNIEKLSKIEESIDSLIFIPEIVSVLIERPSHYEYMGKNGFYINKIHYTRLLCGSGNARRNTVFFIDGSYEKQLKEILNNGRKDIELVPNKFNAYYALASSSSLPVSTPYYCVVPDYIEKKEETVEFIQDNPNGDDFTSVQNRLIDFTRFDGQGLISPKFAQQWASDLGLDYIPSTFIIRSNFIKGMVCVFDFHRFSDECGQHFVTDMWGSKYNIRDADIILTQSQFKLWNAWNSANDYSYNCEKNEITWNVSKWSPKEEKSHTNLNYQFIQVLNLGKSQIESLCEKTVNFFQQIMGNINSCSLLYLLGESISHGYDEKIFNKISDIVTKSLILNPNLIDDPYIKNHIIHSLNKKIKESYIGNVIVDGFYTTIINDPYAFCEYIFGLPVEGLLKRDEHYNKVWIDKGNNILASMRAPLTWKSEINILHLKNNPEIDDWYKYLNIGCIFNVHGCDHMLQADSDADGDMICLTDQYEVIRFAAKGLPITYETKKIEKKKIIEEELYKSDLQGFFSSVGFLTNLSTSLYSMLPCFNESSDQYKAIVNRLKQCRKEQGSIIDSQKGLEIRPLPKYWTIWSKTKSDDNDLKKKLDSFNNSIIIENRPYFFRHLYSDYNRKYSNYNFQYENYCSTTFGKTLQEILRNPITDKEKEIKNKYYKFNPLLDSDCVMNNLCHYLEGKIKEIKNNIDKKSNESLIKLLKDESIPVDKDKLKKLYDIYRVYKTERRNFANIKNSNGDEIYKTIEQYCKHIRQESLKISSNICELANLAVDICYEAHPSDSKTFVWNVFGEGIIKNIELHKVNPLLVPFFENCGEMEFVGKKYSVKEINPKEENYIDEYYL